MTADPGHEAGELLRTARAVYGGDAVATAVIDELERRRNEPLRLAIAGMVKAGKSTLLNALLGEQIAPTDAGECTRVVTWYRYAQVPTVTMHLTSGEERRMRVRRRDDRLVFDLGDTPAEDVAFLDVGWPISALRSVILIDTPGIASLSADTSARAAGFLAPADSATAADAVIYLMRHLHPADLKFLEAFRDTAAGAWQTVCAVGVLSRADEIGSGRIDSLLSARKVAARYEQQGHLASLVLGALPVAGLVAQAARTLREDEYMAFVRLAALDREARELLLVSADRFTGPSDAVELTSRERTDLLDRFGIFGIRLATALIRGGAGSSSALAEQLVAQSGVHELQGFLREQFRSRAAVLKVRGILMGLEKLLDERPRDDAQPIRDGIERLSAGSHALRELSLLAAMRGGDVPLPEATVAEAQRILGADGTPPTRRLGLADDASPGQLQEAADALLASWRRRSANPLTERAGVAACHTVLRTLAQVRSEAAVGAADGPGDGAQVVLPG
ncbi:MAG: dynamin family protein [Microbacterium sp.]|uniref:dynamin family protein n=1 Tax=Microbacterium sp. TaxID=51671 RepID=UPI003A8C1DEB